MSLDALLRKRLNRAPKIGPGVPFAKDWRNRSRTISLEGNLAWRVEIEEMAHDAASARYG